MPRPCPGVACLPSPSLAPSLPVRLLSAMAALAARLWRQGSGLQRGRCEQRRPPRDAQDDATPSANRVAGAHLDLAAAGALHLHALHQATRPNGRNREAAQGRAPYCTGRRVYACSTSVILILLERIDWFLQRGANGGEFLFNPPGDNDPRQDSRAGKAAARGEWFSSSSPSASASLSPSAGPRAGCALRGGTWGI